VLIFLSFIALVFGLTASVQMIAERRLSAFGSLHMEITAAMSLVIGVVVDIVVFAAMSYSLCRIQTRGFLPIATKVFTGRGLGFTLTQVAYLLAFVAAPSRQLWIPFQMTASKLYVNTVLGQLNLREARQGQGLNEEDSLVNRRAPTNGRLSASIRFNGTDTKATTQSVSFVTTQQKDAESVITGLDSKNTYDEHGSEYAQVSTGSSQSQTDEAVKICSLDH